VNVSRILYTLFIEREVPANQALSSSKLSTDYCTSKIHRLLLRGKKVAKKAGFADVENFDDVK